MKYLVFLFIFSLFCRQIPTRKYTSYLNRLLGRCPGAGKPKAWYENITISYLKSGALRLDFAIVVDKPFDDPLQSTWTVERCSSKETLDTCYQFGVFKVKKFCQLFARRNEAWSSFHSCTKPSFLCPFKKGIYYGRNCTIDPNIAFLPLPGSYWKVKAETIDMNDNSLAYCVIMEGGVFVEH